VEDVVSTSFFFQYQEDWELQFAAGIKVTDLHFSTIVLSVTIFAYIKQHCKHPA
jgi:hypothetical protein